MKKIVSTVLTTGVCALSFAASAPIMHNLSPFQGFYLGAGLGVAGYLTKASDVKFATTDANGSFNHGAAGFAAELLAGYDFVYNNAVAVGLGANYMYNTAKIVNRYSRNDFSARDKYTGHSLFGGVVQLGYLPTPTSMVFFNVGPEWGYFKSSSVASGASSSKNYTQFMLNFELGSKQSIADSRWFLQEKIGYMFATSKKTVTHNNNYTAKVKPQFITGMIDVGYTF